MAPDAPVSAPSTGPYTPGDRVRARAEYRAVYETGGAIHTAHLVFYALAAEAGVRRLGITVPKKTGKAVERNRIKRLVREVFRRERGSLPDGCVLVVNAKRDASRLDFEGVTLAFARVCERLSQEGFPPCRR